MTANGSGSRIRVFDESGELIGTTFPKRARGLVKNGRARWLADTPNIDRPDAPTAEPDSIILYRHAAGAEAESAAHAPQKTTDTEDIMNEFNNNGSNNNGTPSETELRIRKIVEQFQEEIIKARELAEKAAAEAQAAAAAARERAKIESLRKERDGLLTRAGYPLNALDTIYTCSKCKDTGQLEDGSRCSCYKDKMRLLTQ